MAGSWCAENSMLPDNQLLDSISSTDLSDQLYDFWVVISSISSNDKEAALYAFWDGEKDTGDERLAVIWLLEDTGLFSKSRTSLQSACEVQLTEMGLGELG